MAGKITTVLTKKEAETYQAQGLHKEARKLYGRLLDSSPNIDPELKSAVQSQIQGINQELEHAATRTHRPLSAKEIIRMRKDWGEKATAPDILVCAQAFIQIGSYDEALKEFKNLLHRTGVKKSYINAIALCLVHLHKPQNLPLVAETLAKEVSNTSKIFLAMQLALAKRMEARQYMDHALAMYKHMCKYPQLSTALSKRIAALSTSIENKPEPNAAEANVSSPSDDNGAQRPGLAARFNPFKLFRSKKKL